MKKILIITTFILSAGSVLAVWNDPTATAPGANTVPPVNVSATAQLKAGGLSVGSLIVSGGATLGTTAATCDSSLDGTVRFEGGVLQICSDDSQDSGSTPSSTDPLLPPSCANGDLAIFNTTGSVWECGPVPETLPACTNGQVVTYNTTTSEWECATIDAGKFTDGTNPNDAVYTTGNVGIGTSNPTAAKLQVEVSAEGTAGLVLKSGVNTYLEVTPELSGNYRTVLDTINNRHLILDTGTGNVGIGSDTPTEGKLVISNTTVTGPGGWYTSIVFDNNSHNAIWNPAGGMFFGLHSDGNFYWGDESGGTHQGYPMTLVSDTGDLTITGALTTGGNVTIGGGRNLWYGTGQMRIHGDDSSAFYFDSNHSTLTQLIFRDLEDTQYGRIYGSGDGANFGTLDGDGNWAFLAAKDNYTDFRINNSVKMRILNNGHVSIGNGGSPSYRLHVEDNTSGYMIKFKNKSTSASADLLYLQINAATPGGDQGWMRFNDNTGNGHGYVSGNGSGVQFFDASDRRLKENIIPITTEEAKSLVLAAEPVRFNWKENGISDIGYVAQDLKKVLPLAVAGQEGETEVVTDSDENEVEIIKYMNVAMNQVVPVVHAGIIGNINDVNELEAELEEDRLIEELEKIVEEQQRQIDLLLKKLN